MVRQSGIYQILNAVNGHRYIGSTIDLRKRLNRHRALLRRGAHENSHLQRAWCLYGAAAFRFSVLEEVQVLEQLLEREQHYLDTLRPEYNMAPNAGSCLGVRHSEETKRKLGRLRKGKKRAPYSAEARLNFSRGQRGRRHPPEIRAKMSQAQRGRTKTAEHRRKIGAAQSGEKSSNAKLTERGVNEIRRLLAGGTLTQREIAARFGVSRSLISLIKHGHAWKQSAMEAS